MKKDNRKQKKKRPKILIIHGPNLHMLGKREVQTYGKFTLSELNEELEIIAGENNIALATFQSNSEGKIVDKITNSDFDFLIINPAAYTHTSVALRDAILTRQLPAIEVHISNTFKREDFRKKSLISDVVLGVITGLGKLSYISALQAAISLLKK